MGEGNIGIDTYLDRFRALCPGRPVMLEVIVMPAPRQLPYRDAQFRAGYPRMTAEDFQRFVDRVEHAPPAALPSGVVEPAAELANVEASIRWTMGTYAIAVQLPVARFPVPRLRTASARTARNWKLDTN